MALKERWACDGCGKEVDLRELWGHGDTVNLGNDVWFQLLTHQNTYCFPCVKKFFTGDCRPLDWYNKAWKNFRSWFSKYPSR